jgi:putative transposase
LIIFWSTYEVDHILNHWGGEEVCMQERKDPLVVGEVYHVFTKSIAGYKIFNSSDEMMRMVHGFAFYQIENPNESLSRVFRTRSGRRLELDDRVKFFCGRKVADILAYCVMPTHIHLILKQKAENGISSFMGNVLNSYARYFNVKHKRKGPLWEGRFKSVLVGDEDQLLHLTRYIHLNPVTAYLVNKPEDWPASSYGEYLREKELRICNFEDVLDIEPDSYRDFVLDQASFQRELANIKKLIQE